LNRTLEKHSDKLKFRVPPNKCRPASWPGVKWGEMEDSMLLVGIAKHGFGEWDQNIANDPDLQLTHKIARRGADKGDPLPRGEKLNRRAEALLQVVLEQDGGGSGLSCGMYGSSKPNKKAGTSKATKGSKAASKQKAAAGSGGKLLSKKARLKGKLKMSSDSGYLKRKKDLCKKRMGEQRDAMEELANLGELEPKAKIKKTKALLTQLGQFIDKHLEENMKKSRREYPTAELELGLWREVHLCGVEMPAEKLRDVYKKLNQRDVGPTKDPKNKVVARESPLLAGAAPGPQDSSVPKNPLKGASGEKKARLYGDAAQADKLRASAVPKKVPKKAKPDDPRRDGTTKRPREGGSIEQRPAPYGDRSSPQFSGGRAGPPVGQPRGPEGFRDEQHSKRPRQEEDKTAWGRPPHDMPHHERPQREDWQRDRSHHDMGGHHERAHHEMGGHHERPYHNMGGHHERPHHDMGGHYERPHHDWRDRNIHGRDDRGRSSYKDGGAYDREWQRERDWDRQPRDRDSWRRNDYRDPPRHGHQQDAPPPPKPSAPRRLDTYD